MNFITQAYKEEREAERVIRAALRGEAVLPPILRLHNIPRGTKIKSLLEISLMPRYTISDLFKYVFEVYGSKISLTILKLNAIFILSFKDYYEKTGHVLFEDTFLQAIYSGISSETLYRRFGIFGGSQLAYLPREPKTDVTLSQDVKEIIDSYVYEDLSDLLNAAKEYFGALEGKEKYSTQEVVTYMMDKQKERQKPKKFLGFGKKHK